MTTASPQEELLGRLRTGGGDALAELFATERDGLRRMVCWRLDPRLNGRLDPSDVLQDVYLDAARRLPEYLDRPALPAALWLRSSRANGSSNCTDSTWALHARSAGQEVSLDNPAWAWASAGSLASQLIGHLTSPSQAAVRAETAARLTRALEEMDDMDREVLILRHFDELSNNEVAALLGLRKAAASNRYVKALKRLKDVLAAMPELDGTGGWT